MDAAQALADLAEISSQIRAAVLFDDDGSVLGETLGDDARAKQLVKLATDLLAAARDVSPSGTELVQVEAATEAGSVFLVGDGKRRIVATTEPEPTVGLVFYDLKSCLRGVDGDEEKTKRPARRRKTEEDGDAT
jgi:predicted regulator of Ras-like GTPase activity (Roadblock/LC7/MglB family)